jgi:hypothetical protein
MDKLLCKDCKFSKVSWIGKLLKEKYAYTCMHRDSWYVPKPDQVLGTEPKGYFQSCATQRSYASECGTDANNWVPKDTSKIFLFLKHK